MTTQTDEKEVKEVQEKKEVIKEKVKPGTETMESMLKELGGKVVPFIPGAVVEGSTIWTYLLNVRRRTKDIERVY